MKTIELKPSEQVWATSAEIVHQMRQDDKAYQKRENLPEWLIPTIAVNPVRKV